MGVSSIIIVYVSSLKLSVFSKDPHAKATPNEYQKPFRYSSHCKYYKHKLLTPVGFLPFKIGWKTKLHKRELAPMKFFE
jgi:hypothetical protein